MDICFFGVHLAKWCTLLLRSPSNRKRILPYRSGFVWNEKFAERFDHPARSIIRHDPGTETLSFSF